MCYPKPGPRCSTHALSKLHTAKARFNKVDPTDLDKLEDAKQKLAVAQEEYLTSPAGIKKLREKAVETGDNKYAVKADGYAAKRKEQIAAFKEFEAAQEKAVLSAKKSPNVTALEEDLANEASERKAVEKIEKRLEAQNERSLAVEKYKAEQRKLSNEFVAVERFNITESLLNTKINAQYENDGTQCGSDGICSAPDDDYCRDSEYVNLRVDPESINTRQTLSNIYGTYISNVPDDLEKIGRDELKLDDPESYDVESEYGYYGVEGAHVTLANPSTVKNRLNEYYENKYQALRKREIELDKNTPKNIKTLANRPAPAKATTRRGSKVGASKAPVGLVTPVKTQRRARTTAELDAFELDAMTPRIERKATLPKAPVAPTKPRRRERTSAELDAFEADERN